MNIAILIVSSASLLCSAGCLCILIKGAKEAQALKAHVDTTIAGVEAKVEHNKKVVKTAIAQLEL